MRAGVLTADATLAFYEREAQRYFDDTVGSDLASLRETFLSRAQPGGLLLDAGCGSGRDAHAFLQRGYRVDAFDASRKLAGLASAFTGIDVEIARFEDRKWRPHRYDGIWAFASLLHVAPDDLPEVIAGITSSLKPGAPLFASFKNGPEVSVDGTGRRFTNLSSDTARGLFGRTEGLTVVRTWSEDGPASLGASAQWTYVLCARTPDLARS